MDIFYPKRGQKEAFFDHLHTSSCPRSFWTTPNSKTCQMTVFTFSNAMIWQDLPPSNSCLYVSDFIWTFWRDFHHCVLEASFVTSGSPVITGSLSASTSNIDQAGHPAAGQKHSWPELTPRSLRKFAALGTGLKFMNILQHKDKSQSSSQPDHQNPDNSTTNNTRSAPSKSNCE